MSDTSTSSASPKPVTENTIARVGAIVVHIRRMAAGPKYAQFGAPLADDADAIEAVLEERTELRRLVGRLSDCLAHWRPQSEDGGWPMIRRAALDSHLVFSNTGRVPDEAALAATEPEAKAADETERPRHANEECTIGGEPETPSATLTREMMVAHIHVNTLKGVDVATADVRQFLADIEAAYAAATEPEAKG